MAREAPHTMDYEVAETIAPTWERRQDFVEEVCAPVRAWMLRELAPQPGDTVLELAAGVGETGFEAAASIGPQGRLISTDFSPAMLDAARRRGAVLGVDNVTYRIVDAERNDLDTDSVDGVLCRFGYMLMNDPGAALAQTHRVLRPGGRLTLAVWGAPERNPFFAVGATALAESGRLPAPDQGRAGLFALADPDRVHDLLRRAGFAENRIEEIPMRFRFSDVAEYLAIVADTAGPIAMALRGLPDAERVQLGDRLTKAFAPFTADGGYELPGAALVAAAA